LSHSFPRDRRLLTAADYRRVFAKPLKSADACFTVLASPASLPVSRLGLAIAKKQLKHAVERNRIKRLVREYFRCHVAADLACDFVVLTRGVVRHKSNRELLLSLQKHFESLIVRCARSQA